MTTDTPTQIIILGGSGDLARRKLIPALLDLFTHKKLPNQFTIVGMARTPRTNEDFREFTASALMEATLEHGGDEIKEFCDHISYVTGAFDDQAAYQKLKQNIDAFELETGVGTNRLFYLAVPPEYYSVIFQNLAATELTTNCSDHEGWARVLVEKPFGNDLKTAQALDAQLSSLFKEEQIFRIDHYLAKEAVQNILSFRFANTLIRSAWHNEDIKEVRISMHESIDVANRGNFYDGIGALRDVGQNHLLQILALIAMDEPETFSAEAIREKRASMLEKLIPFTSDTVRTQFIRGQYEGYRDTKGVAPDSDTETYFCLTAYLDEPHWQGIPFYIEAGKGMDENRVTVEVIFNEVTTGPFEDPTCTTHGNRIVISISPKQTMQMVLNAKAPGYGFTIEEQTLSIMDMDMSKEIPAYQKVLLDCIAGDQTLFTETREVLASWRFINSIFDKWYNVPLHVYPKGSTSEEIKALSAAQ